MFTPRWPRYASRGIQWIETRQMIVVSCAGHGQGIGTPLMTVNRTSCSHHYHNYSSASPCCVLSCPLASPLGVAALWITGAAGAACLPSAATC
jgi:hypothetical protein